MMATKAEKNFEKALLELAGEDVSTALSVLTGCFVSLTLEVLRRNGHVTDGDIKIDGGDQRDITIHPLAKRRDELQTKADAMAETINAIAGLCTYQHESKEDFIGRVRAVLGDDPDLRLSIVRKERDELLAALEPFATAFKPAAEQLRKYGASDVMLTYLDRNTVTPTMTMGDFRRAFEAVTGTKCHGQQEKQAETETTVPALVFFPAGSLGEEVEP